MKLTVGGTGGDYPVLEEDSYLARIYKIFDIGLQDGMYGEKPQIIICWELPDIEGPDGPHTLSKFYTTSLSPKANLRKDTEAMTTQIPEAKLKDPAFLDTFFQKLVGTTALLSVSKYQNAQNYDRNKIVSISKPPKSMVCPAAINKPSIFDLDNPDWAEYDASPEWMRDKCNMPAGTSPHAVAQPVGEVDDAIPGFEEEEEGW